MFILITILNTLLANYSEEVGYRWPEDEFVTKKRLVFATYDDMSALRKGERECFTLEEIAPVEVCGTVTGAVKWNEAWFVGVDVD